MGGEDEEIIVIGGGLAGLSLASELVDEEFSVTVLEKNSYLGGRASSTTDPETDDPVPIAPHVFVTAYSNLQRFFDKIGAENAIYWQEDIFNEVYYKGERAVLKHNNLPPPLYLAKLFSSYKFIGKWDLVKGLWPAYRTFVMPDRAVESLDDRTAYEYLQEENVPDTIIDKFYRYMSKSLLNTPLEQVSAAEFVMLLKDWMKLDNREFGFANGGLGDVYTGHAREYIEERGGTIKTNVVVKEIVFADDGDTIEQLVVQQDGDEQVIEADTVVSTMHPVDLRNVLPEDVLETEFFGHLKAFEGVPYFGVFLWFDEKITEKYFWSLLNTGDTDYLNTDFYDKSNLPGIDEENSYITSNVIHTKEYQDMSDDEVIEKTMEELQEVFPEMDADLVHSHVHRVDYAIYAPYPGMREHKRPHETPVENFYLAGDWTIDELPQCMEGAVRSGYRCAEKILATQGIEKELYNPVVK